MLLYENANVPIDDRLVPPGVSVCLSVLCVV